MELELRLAHTMLEAHPQDATVVLESLPLEEAAQLLERARPSSGAQVLQWGAPHFAAAVLERLSPSSAGPLIELLPPEVAAGLLRRIEEPARKSLLAALPPKCARPVESLLRFPPGTAGSLMDAHALGLPRDLTVQQALQRLREEAEGLLFNVYVLDRSDALVGVVNLRKILTAAPGDRLDAIMRSPVSSIPASADRVAILTQPAWQELHSLPVVDERGVFLGAIRYRTFRRLERELLQGGGDPRAPTIQALGELFSAGVGGVMGAMATALGPAPEPRGSSEG